MSPAESAMDGMVCTAFLLLVLIALCWAFDTAGLRKTQKPDDEAHADALRARINKEFETRPRQKPAKRLRSIRFFNF